MYSLAKKRKLVMPLILAISLLFVFSSTYFHYNALKEADFLCYGLKFEASDLEDLFFDKQNVGDLKPDLSLFFSLANMEFYRWLSHPSFLFPYSDQSPSILRC
jgi:hypothetical protein